MRDAATLVTEEHRAGPAHHDSELGRLERVHLCVGLLEHHVGDTVGSGSPAGVVEHRGLAAQNRRDLDAFVACFHPDYRSEQPVHPDRAFVGSEQVRKNWSAVFEGVPDFHAELLRTAQADDAWWAEWHWHGTHADGTALDMRGVTIFGVRDDRLTWGRLYLEDVDDTGQGIGEVVKHMATGE